MDEDGLAIRPVHVTERGRPLEPVILALKDWGDVYGSVHPIMVDDEERAT